MAEGGEGSYVCTLDEKTLEKAKKELNEDPKQRASQIEAFREWVKTQPHITSRTGIQIKQMNNVACKSGGVSNSYLAALPQRYKAFDVTFI